MSHLFYSSVEDVLNYTGIRPADLGFKDDKDDGGDPEDSGFRKTAEDKLAAFIEARLIEIKDMIDRDRNRDYHAEINVPPGIHHIALRIMKNLMGHAVMSRSTPIVRVDDFTIRMVEDQVFTPAIKRDLRTYPAKPRLRMFRVSGKEREQLV